MLEGYGVIFSRASLKDLKKIPRRDREYILQIIEEKLSIQPYCLSIKLEGKKDVGQWRTRIGMYRIRFDIIERQLFIYRIRHRKDIYRDQ